MTIKTVATLSDRMVRAVCCCSGTRLTPVKYISPLVSNNYCWGVELREPLPWDMIEPRQGHHGHIGYVLGALVNSGRACIRFPTYNPAPSDLRHATIDEQLDARDVAAVIRREEDNGFGYLVECSRPAQRRAGRCAGLVLLNLFIAHHAAIGGCDNHAGADSVDANLAIFKSTDHVRANDRTAALVAL